MSVALVTGSAGLIGSEACARFASDGYDVVGIDNDMRSTFFGGEASTCWNLERLRKQLGPKYSHHAFDIRDRDSVEVLFRSLGTSTSVVIHTAAQPSHDWAAQDPETDFSVNALGTLTLLQATRKHSPDAAFIFTSTNKVYGDTPNRLPLRELATRWEIDPRHRFSRGIDESMSIDQTLHSPFGASKLAADVLVQEFGKYFGMNTVCFRGGCLTGPSHTGVKLHGFLAYLVRCAATGTPYTVLGYGGKQVRDNIHSEDLVAAFAEFARAPRQSEVYNIGGGRHSNCSVTEAINLCEALVGRAIERSYSNENRKGDHIWWISDNTKFSSHYPSWRQKHSMTSILTDILDRNSDRWRRQVPGTTVRAP